MAFKEGVNPEDVQKFRMIETYVHELDQQIDGGALTPHEAMANLSAKIDEVWNATHPEPESTRKAEKLTPEEKKELETLKELASEDGKRTTAQKKK